MLFLGRKSCQREQREIVLGDASVAPVPLVLSNRVKIGVSSDATMTARIADLQTGLGVPSLRDPRRVGPDDLPLAITLFVRVGMPVARTRIFLSLHDYFDLGPIANQRDLAVNANFNR